MVSNLVRVLVVAVTVSVVAAPMSARAESRGWHELSTGEKTAIVGGGVALGAVAVAGVLVFGVPALVIAGIGAGVIAEGALIVGAVGALTLLAGTMLLTQESAAIHRENARLSAETARRYREAAESYARLHSAALDALGSNVGRTSPTTVPGGAKTGRTSTEGVGQSR